jgi:hypothetical protein
MEESRSECFPFGIRQVSTVIPNETRGWDRRKWECERSGAFEREVIELAAIARKEWRHEPPETLANVCA